MTSKSNGSFLNTLRSSQTRIECSLWGSTLTLFMLLGLKTLLELICSCPQNGLGKNYSSLLQSPHMGRTVGQTRHTYTLTHLMYQLDSRRCLWPFSKTESSNEKCSPLQRAFYRMHQRDDCQTQLLDLTDITHKFCSDSLPVKMMGETLQSKAFFANKILQPLFKIKHKLASLVRQQADSIPLCRASFIYIKFNTVSSSQSDNRVRELN